MRPDMARYALMSTCSYGAMLTASGGLSLADIHVHKWLCAMLADVRAREAKPTKAAA